MSEAENRLYEIGSWVKRRPVWSLLVATAAVSVLFLVFPQLDLAVSGLFYVPGQGFVGADMGILQTIRDIGKDALRITGAVILVSLIVPLLIGRVRYLLPLRAALFLFTSLVLGPGLLVNGILKELWGRARPRSITEFGGDFSFSRAWEIVNQCESNCSFVSGEGSSAIWFLALAMIVPLRWRLTAALAALVFAAVMSLNRIVFGGHFLSDVLIAWTVTLAVTVICYNVFYKEFGLTDEIVDAGFERARLFLRRWAQTSWATLRSMSLRLRQMIADVWTDDLVRSRIARAGFWVRSAGKASWEAMRALGLRLQEMGADAFQSCQSLGRRAALKLGDARDHRLRQRKER